MFETLLSSLTTFGAIPGFDLVDIIITLGIFAILVVIFAESGLLIGFFLPGDSLLFTAGYMVQQNILHLGSLPFNINIFIGLYWGLVVDGGSGVFGLGGDGLVPVFLCWIQIDDIC